MDVFPLCVGARTAGAILNVLSEGADEDAAAVILVELVGRVVARERLSLGGLLVLVHGGVLLV